MNELSFGNEDVILTRTQEKALFEALSKAFSLEELDQMLYFKLEVSLEQISTGTSGTAVVFKLVQWLTRHGRVAEFIRIAYEQNPTNRKLHEVAKEIGLVADAPPKKRLADMLQLFAHEFDMAPDLAQNQQFERMLEAFARELELVPAPQASGQPVEARSILAHGALTELSSFIGLLTEAKRRVCRVEIEGKPSSTGFLVGPNKVMTVSHGFQNKRSDILDSVECRFDFELREDGSVNAGEVFTVVPQQPLADSSPPSQVDISGGESLPADDELDYAILNLEAVIGEERGWYDVKETAPLEIPGTILLIHHLQGQPLKCSLGETRSLNLNQTRCSHLTRTGPGSAGGPCLDLNGNVIAMHHAKERDFTKAVRLGKAIPLAAIGRLLTSRNIELA